LSKKDKQLNLFALYQAIMTRQNKSSMAEWEGGTRHLALFCRMKCSASSTVNSCENRGY
jgi:hypothetical protein